MTRQVQTDGSETTSPLIDPVPRINVLGVGVSVLNLPLTARMFTGAVERKQRGYVCVTGVHGIIEAQQDEQFRRILNQAYLNTPDGMPMVWLGRAHGFKEMDRVYGPDLMLEMCQTTLPHGLRHFFYGGANGVAEELRRRLTARFPGLQVAGVYEPPFRPLDSSEASALELMVRDTRPDIFWVGLSTPKQEKFMAAFLPRLETTLMVGVGAAFDFHAGRIRQAPRWVQRSGFEWLFRTVMDPRRLWRRYLKNNPWFLWLIFCQGLGLKKFPMDEPRQGG